MSIPVILASSSKIRRSVLMGAGICPEIRESHVDEDAVAEEYARTNGIRVEEIPTQTRVRILAAAKAQAIYDLYQELKGAASEAEGERLTHRPYSSSGQEQSGLSRSDIKELIESSRSQMGEGQGPLLVAADSMLEVEHEVDGRLVKEAMGKPHTPENARHRLRESQGKTSTLFTGHCLINMATGQKQEFVAQSQVAIAPMNDQEIEAYVATGEPLEVAGAFTLEGFGGAFIEAVHGEASNVLGLSLNRMRLAASELGIRWSDLWNISFEEKNEKNPDNPDAPTDNVHQPGDGWIDCVCGHQHWGLNGAAGVLLARRDPETKKVTHVVLQHRALWSAEGGTWGVPGGALADGESSLEGGLRECYEEANFHPKDIEIKGSYCEDHGPWRYVTIFAFEKEGHVVEPAENDDESLSVEWIPIDDVENLKLLSYFKDDWPHFRGILDELGKK